MDYQIGSLADLISGSNTPNKRKVFKREISPQPEEQTRKKKRANNLTLKTQAQSKCPKDTLQKRTQIDKEYVAPLKKVKSKTRTKTIENNTDQENVEKNEPDNESQVGLYNDRTIFVGNVSINTSKSKLRKLFEKFGKIEAIRFRCVPLADPRTSKKVATIKKEYHPDRQALHSYVRFATRDEALKALTLNGHIYKDLHLRVNICDETEKPATMKAVFIGNIPFDAEEEDLWKLFEGCGAIESVRLIRDSRTNIGKGFGYVNFKSPDAVHLAMEMDDLKLKNRILRVSQCKAVSAKKNKKKLRKKPNIKKHKTLKNVDSSEKYDKDSLDKSEQKNKDGTTVESTQNSIFQGKTFVETRKKKKFDRETQRKKKMIKQIAPK